MFAHESVVLPSRKRRRPALSCIECRRRKIKCDRNDPCTQCTRSKSATCTYKDGYPGPPNGHGHGHSHTANANSTVTSSISPSPKTDGHLGPCGLILPFEPCVSTADTNLALTSHGSTPRTVPLFNVSHSNSSTLYSPSSGSPEEQSEHNVQFLHERVSKLEQNLSTVSQGNLDPAWTSFSTNDNKTVPVPELRGSVSKTRLFGQSHWMSSFEHFKKISNFRNETGIETVLAPPQQFKTSNGKSLFKDPIDPCSHIIKTSEIKTLLEKCKTMARAAKAERTPQWHSNPNFKDHVPSREISDTLVQLYLRTFESTYRILHIPSFEREYQNYWNDPQNANTGFLVKLLLVMAIGTTFYQGPDFHDIRASAQQWVYAAQSWMSAPFEKVRLNLSGLQVHCLVLIARQATGVGGDLVWISVGSLVRMAITMGFHREPKLFPKMTILHAELRRRLWATVVEMAVMSSFDSGNPALISPDDWDTDPPSNINDEEIDETTTEPPVSKPSEVYTQTSIQIQLLKSLRTRLEISRLVSDFRFRPAYDDILRLGTEILSFGSEGLLLAQCTPEGSLKPTTLQRNMLDAPIRRVLLALHFPSAMKARTDPRFYFSRKVCLDAAITIITYPCTTCPTSPSPLEAPHDDYTRLKLVGAGFMKELLIYASIIVQLELIAQLEEGAPSVRNEGLLQAQKPLKAYVAYMLDLTAQRISLGENNIKGHLFLSAVSAQVDALERGIDPDLLIAKAAKDSAEMCYGLLKNRIRKPPSSVVMEESEDVGGKDRNGGNGMLEFGSMDTETEFAFEYLMPDANVNFDIPESWLFEGWEEHQEW